MKTFKLLLCLLLSFCCSPIMGMELPPELRSHITSLAAPKSSHKHPIDFLANATILPQGWGVVCDILQDPVTGKVKVLTFRERSTEFSFKFGPLLLAGTGMLLSEPLCLLPCLALVPWFAFCKRIMKENSDACGEFLICDVSSKTIESRVLVRDFVTFKKRVCAYFLGDANKFEIKACAGLHSFCRNAQSGECIKTSLPMDEESVTIRETHSTRHARYLGGRYHYSQLKGSSEAAKLKRFCDNEVVHGYQNLRRLDSVVPAASEEVEAHFYNRSLTNLKRYIAENNEVRPLMLSGSTLTSFSNSTVDKTMFLPIPKGDAYSTYASMKTPSCNFVLLRINDKNVVVDLRQQKLSAQIEMLIEGMIDQGTATIDLGGYFSLKLLGKQKLNKILENLHEFCSVERKPSYVKKLAYNTWYTAKVLVGIPSWVRSLSP